MRRFPYFSLLITTLLGASLSCGFMYEKIEEAEPGEVVFSGTEIDFGDAERVWFINPTDGAEVKSPFSVDIGLQGVIIQGIRQAPEKGYGHHHILIDRALPQMEEVIPNNEHHLHLHRLETGTTLSLPPGPHTLTLVFGDTRSRPYEPLLTDSIEINVTTQQQVFFIQPIDGESIKELPYDVKVSSEGVDETGGHYVIVLAPFPFPPEGEPVPEDEEHIHLPPGITEFQLDFATGGRPLHVLWVDQSNMLNDPPLYESIDVVVWATKTMTEGTPPQTPR